MIELLVVVALIILLIALVIPAVTGRKSASDLDKAAADISGALELARTHAMAQNTYAWVGFFEEDPTSNTVTIPRTTGTGRIIVSVVASADGRRYKDTPIDLDEPHKFGSADLSNPVTLVQIGKLLKIENSHLSGPIATASTNGAPRPSVPTEYQVGDADPPDNRDFSMHPQSFGSTWVKNPTTFTYPIRDAAPPYEFVKVIEFNPAGEASKILDYPTPWLEVGLRLARGNRVDKTSPNVIALQVSGATGEVKQYRP